MKAYSLSGDRMFPDPNGRWVHRENYDALVAAARAVSVASAAITLHPDGRAYFDSGAATKHFRGALAALLEVLDEVPRHG